MRIWIWELENSVHTLAQVVDGKLWVVMQVFSDSMPTIIEVGLQLCDR